MSISGTLTTGTTETNSGTITNEVSSLHITGDFKGYVSLQITPVGTTNWLTIISYNIKTAVPINTPDTTMLYRFRAVLTSGSAVCYLGA